MKNKGLQVSFAWLFSIIVGAMILFLAIYMVTQFMGPSQQASNIEVAKKVENLLSPLETGFESAVKTKMEFNVETRIENGCDLKGDFGNQILTVSQKYFEEWSDSKDVNEIKIKNKYIFSERRIEGENFVIFLKPFEFPFKVADLTYVFPLDKWYCFKDAPEKVENEISSLGFENILFDESECGRHSEIIDVCFEGVCDITVDYDEEEDKGVVNHDVNFYGTALMYAAIFSDKDTYECQLARLMKRAEILNKIYLDKIELTGCSENLKPELLSLSGSLRSFSGSENLNSLAGLVESIDEKNEDNRVCSIW